MSTRQSKRYSFVPFGGDRGIVLDNLTHKWASDMTSYNRAQAIADKLEEDYRKYCDKQMSTPAGL